MNEIGIDLSHKVRKQVTESMLANSDSVIVMAEKADVPLWLLNSPKVSFWDIPDASGTSLEFHRETRDAIKERLHRFIGGK